MYTARSGRRSRWGRAGLVPLAIGFPSPVVAAVVVTGVCWLLLLLSASGCASSLSSAGLLSGIGAVKDEWL